MHGSRELRALYLDPSGAGVPWLLDPGSPRCPHGTAVSRPRDHRRLLRRGCGLLPLLLDDDEAVAVAVGLRTAAGGTVAGMAETSVRALAKLEQVLPARLRHRVNALQSVTVPVAVPGSPPRDPPAVDLAADASYGVSTGAYRYRSTVTVHAPAETVAERVPPTVGTVAAVGATSCRLYVGANDLDELAVHIGLLGFEFQVDDPPELVDHLRSLADRIRRAVGR